jgi:hypothetical protein|tara:strand:+ start:3245 stop:3742 length:498 start_codon:yes stop_codon:yes gene_type:complete
MATIDQFKAQLIGGGPRANRFKVFIPRAGNKIEFLCKAANIPAGTLGEVVVPFRGHNLKLAGERTFEDWQITVINDVEFSVRSGLEAWQEEIQAMDSGVGSTSTDYLISRAFVEQLNKDDSVLARYEFFNMFPKNIGAIELSYDTVDALEEFTVDFTFSHWERVQ